MNVELIEYTQNPVIVCSKVAAVCYGKTLKDVENEPYEKAVARFKRCVDLAHDSVLEHASFTFFITGISRVAQQQLTRHRMASYMVESQRYTKQTGSVYLPPSLKNNLKVKKTIALVNELYFELIESGIKKEDARYILPMGTDSSMYVTCNLRELRHIFKLRNSKKAQHEIRTIIQKMMDILKNKESLLLYNIDN